MKHGRTNHSAAFKSKVAVEALKGLKSTAELASTYGIHPNQISKWKKLVLEELPVIFSSRRAKATQDAREEMDRLYQEVGKLQIELTWLKKKLDLDE
jgi:transposase-like protein